jgi:hypothetical protein
MAAGIGEVHVRNLRSGVHARTWIATKRAKRRLERGAAR